MAVEFFGQYLLAENILTREQLLDAITYQESQNLKLGEHAVKGGLISKEDADRINVLQQHKDLRFGEAAVELDLLTTEQVNTLLTLQRNDRVYLGDAVVRRGHADQQTIDRALADFAAQQAPYEPSDKQLYKLGIPEETLYTTCIDITQKLLLRVWDVQNKPGKVNTQAGSITLDGYRVRVHFTGQWNCRLMLAAPTAVIAVAANKLLGDNDPDADTCEDLIREFANVVCGNTAAVLARTGRSIDISPPETITGEVSLGVQKALRIPLVSPHGEVVMALTY